MAAIDVTMRGLLQCDCEECECIKPVDREKFFENGGLCYDCNNGDHEEAPRYDPTL